MDVNLKIAYLNRMGDEIGANIIFQRYGHVLEQFSTPQKTTKHKKSLGDIIMTTLGERAVEREHESWSRQNI